MPVQAFRQPTASPRRKQSPATLPSPKRSPASPPNPDAGVNADGSADLCEITCIDGAKVERTRGALPAPATVAALGETFKALGDPTRLLIVAALAHEELCVCDLATLVGVSQSAVSHSLRTLRQLRLVRYRKVGKIAYYTLDDAHIARLVGEGVRHVEEGR